MKKNIGDLKFRRELLKKTNIVKSNSDDVKQEIKKDISGDEKYMKDQKNKKNEIMEDLYNTKNHYPLHSDYENDPKKYDISVGFLIIATGNYDVYIDPLIKSIENFVLPHNKKFYYIFSNKNINLDLENYKVLNIEHKPFPYPTLYRFHFFDRYFEEIKTDQIIYIDADSIITSNIGTEIINPITVTQHCGFVKRLGTFENRMNSRCFVSRLQAKNYYGGGFYSLSRDEFKKMMLYCKDLVDKDSERGIIPIWHDESALNRYTMEIVPSRVLSPSYHYPENNSRIYSSWGGENFECKILLLNKDHKEIRK